MKKILVIILAGVLFPVLAFAQTYFEGNPACCDLGYCDSELVIETPVSGNYSDGTLSVNLVVIEEKCFDWSSNIPVNAVIVKGGLGANLYEYDPASTGSANVCAPDPYSIASIRFCYLEEEPQCPCEISGDIEILEGETTELCGNEIAGATYSWTGPLGFISTNRCITIGEAGQYELTIIGSCGEGVCSVILTFSEEPPPTAKYIPLPDDFNTSILATIGELFTDLSPMVASIGIGLPVAFWGVRKVISLSRFR